MSFQTGVFQGFQEDAFQLDSYQIPLGPIIIALLIDDVDVWPDVEIKTSRFRCSAKNVPGTCTFRLKDTDRTRAVRLGGRTLLTINGVSIWKGYATRVKHGFYLAAGSGEPENPRFIEVNGVDLNILFQKRVVFDPAAPEKNALTGFPPGSADDVIIKHYIENYLDLSGDDIGVDRIQHVGEPSHDSEVSASSGWTWGDMMKFFSFGTGAIWTIDPDGQVVYTDDDYPDAPFIATDNPTPGDPNMAGVREVEVEVDGTQLTTDCMAWGVGQGIDHAVFSRSRSNEALYGTWQHGIFNPTVWRQATINRIAESVVMGSPQNRRGHRAPNLAARFVLFRHGLRVGMKIQCEFETLGFSEVLPVRALEVTFPAPNVPRYEVIASHELDDPWTTFEFWFPNFDIPNFEIDLPEIGLPTNPCVGEDDWVATGDPVVLDTFDRNFHPYTDDDVGNSGTPENLDEEFLGEPDEPADRLWFSRLGTLVAEGTWYNVTGSGPPLHLIKTDVEKSHSLFGWIQPPPRPDYGDVEELVLEGIPIGPCEIFLDYELTADFSGDFPIDGQNALFGFRHLGLHFFHSYRPVNDEGEYIGQPPSWVDGAGNATPISTTPESRIHARLQLIQGPTGMVGRYRAWHHLTDEPLGMWIPSTLRFPTGVNRPPRPHLYPNLSILHTFGVTGSFKLWEVSIRAIEHVPCAGIVPSEGEGSGTLEFDDSFPDPETGHTYFNVGSKFVPGTTVVHAEGQFLRPGIDYVELPEDGYIDVDGELIFAHVRYRVY